MPESFRTRAYAERPSNQLGVWDYFKNSAIYVLMPVIGIAAGLGIRKVIKAPVLNAPYEGMGGLFRRGDVLNEAIEAANKAKHYIPRQAEVWGFGVGTAVGAYNLWKNTRKEQLDVGNITESVQKLHGMESANQFLARENDELRQQISFRDRHASQAPVASHAERHAPAAGTHADRLADEAHSEAAHR